MINVATLVMLSFNLCMPFYLAVLPSDVFASYASPGWTLPPQVSGSWKLIKQMCGAILPTNKALLKTGVCMLYAVYIYIYLCILCSISCLHGAGFPCQNVDEGRSVLMIGVAAIS